MREVQTVRSYVVRCVEKTERIENGNRWWFVRFTPVSPGGEDDPVGGTLLLQFVAETDVQEFVVGRHYDIAMRWTRERNHPQAERYD